MLPADKTKKTKNLQLRERPLSGSCNAATIDAANDSNGPEADMVDKGGKLPFAALANGKADFHKADIRFDCRAICQLRAQSLGQLSDPGCADELGVRN